MDNVTHALAGLLVAEALVTLTARPGAAAPSAAFRRRAWFVSALTNNLPDFDFLYRPITEGRVGYLLHHRGHTHTLLVGFLLGLVTFLVADALAKREYRRPRINEAPPDPATLGRERAVVFGLSLAGPFIHIGLDFFNNYGVHPFWPFDDDWVYGDSIFIIEPWFLVFTVPPLFFASRAVWAKTLLALALGAGVGLAWLLPLAGWLTALVLSAGAAGWFWWCTSRGSERRAVQSLIGSLLVLLIFVVAGRVARARVLGAQAGQDIRHLDAVLTPAPSNPLCWSAITVSERADRYELRVASVSLIPALLRPEDCRFEPSGASLRESNERMEPGERSEEHSGERGVGRAPAGLRWELGWNAPLAEFQQLWRSNCQAAAFLRYSRAPYFFGKNPHEVYIGDLRYDREPHEEFAEVTVPKVPSDCPRFVPPWRPPRHELLETR